MARIEIPRIDWLVNKCDGRFVTNTYSCSLGTVADSGCIGTRTFNFRVYADTSSNVESDFLLIAESYIIQPWHLGSHKTDFERAQFVCSREGVEQAGEWLLHTAAKYGF